MSSTHSSDAIIEDLVQEMVNSIIDSIALPEEEKEPELESMNINEYSRYLDLICNKELTNESIESKDSLKTFFPLRHISRMEALITDTNEEILGNKDVKSCLSSEKQTYILRHKPIETEEQKQFILKREKLRINQRKRYERQKLLQLVISDSICGPIGRRLYRTLGLTDLKTNQIEEAVNRNESFCQHFSGFKGYLINKYNVWNCRSIERKTFRTNFTKKSSHNCFQYSFNRRQRLEKMKRLSTGLNWKSRLMALNCKKSWVVLDNPREPNLNLNLNLNECEQSVTYKECNNYMKMDAIDEEMDFQNNIFEKII